MNGSHNALIILCCWWQWNQHQFCRVRTQQTHPPFLIFLLGLPFGFSSFFLLTVVFSMLDMVLWIACALEILVVCLADHFVDWQAVNVICIHQLWISRYQYWDWTLTTAMRSCGHCADMMSDSCGLWERLFLCCIHGCRFVSVFTHNVCNTRPLGSDRRQTTTA